MAAANTPSGSPLPADVAEVVANSGAAPGQDVLLVRPPANGNGATYRPPDETEMSAMLETLIGSARKDLAALLRR
jgi:hypothetical protein